MKFDHKQFDNTLTTKLSSLGIRIINRRSYRLDEEKNEIRVSIKARSSNDLNSSFFNTLRTQLDFSGVDFDHIKIGTFRYNNTEGRFTFKITIKKEAKIDTSNIDTSSISNMVSLIGQSFKVKRTTYTITSVGGSGMYSISVKTQNNKRYSVKPSFIYENLLATNDSRLTNLLDLI